jgi:hypothetical protein
VIIWTISFWWEQIHSDVTCYFRDNIIHIAIMSIWRQCGFGRIANGEVFAVCVIVCMDKDRKHKECSLLDSNCLFGDQDCEITSFVPIFLQFLGIWLSSPDLAKGTFFLLWSVCKIQLKYFAKNQLKSSLCCFFLFAIKSIICSVLLPHHQVNKICDHLI